MTGPNPQLQPSPNRQELEKLWHNRLEEARKKHQIAAASFRKAASAFASKQTSQPDGDLQRALKLESAARQEYMRILHMFTDLVMHGKPPEETDQD